MPELATARCGYLVVPENRARPAGRTIRLIVATLPAASPRPKPEPVVHLASGPGGIGLGEIPFLIRSGLNRNHDLIVMNQRGTFLSEPALTCESTTAFGRRLISLRFYSESTERAHLAATRGALIDWLRKKAFDTPLLRQVPDQISELAAGRLASVAKDRAAETVVSEPVLGDGLAFGAICREWNPFGQDEPVAERAFPAYPASIQRQLVGSFAYARQDCDQVWRVPSGGPAIRRPPRADIPTLLVAGTFDSVASVRSAKLAARDLRNATLIQIPGVGHGVTEHSECAQDVVASFLSHPNAPDTSCVPKQTVPPFT